MRYLVTALASCLFASVANAVTIDFEEYSGASPYQSVDLTTSLDEGFTMTVSEGDAVWLPASVGPQPSTTSVALSGGGDGGVYLRLVQDDGLAFDLDGFDLAFGATGNFSFGLAAVKSNGIQVALTVDYFENDLNQFSSYIAPNLFKDIVFLQITNGLSTPPLAIDNISLSVVPIPAAAWLFGSALAGLGWLRRKQAA